jgi:hypothetical protein
MKTLLFSLRLSLVLLAVMGISSCENNVTDNAGSGTIEFSISIPDQGAKSTADSTNASFHVLISVIDLDSNVVFTDKLIPLYIFGTGFVSESIEIKAGEYLLTKFMVINTSGEVIYASPLAGSPLSYLTTRPLPFRFKIAPNQVSRIIPEVLAVGDQAPERFGYVNFGVQIIKPLDFWTICVLDPSPLMPPIVITTARLTVMAPDGWHYTFNLKSEVNHIIIRGGYEMYTFVLEKEGYMPQKMQFPAKVLASTTKENPLILSINWNSQLKKLVLQPGPEKGKDAMISNLNPDQNFGDHKYFEATFLSEPVLTVMRSNRSLIQFSLDSLPKSAVIRKVVLRVAYDVPIPFDNTYVTDKLPSAGIAWYGGVLQQIVEPWDEHMVTWNKQPKTIETNQVYIPPFIRNTNIIEIDVTRLFIPPTNSTDQVSYPNFGMLFRTWPAERFPGFRFASSDYPLTSTAIKMWPALTIYYSLQ